MNRFDPPISEKSLTIPPFLVMDVLERAVDLAAKGQDIIHLEVGEPDFDTPANIVEAGIDAMPAAGRTHYTPSVGLPELRHTIADHYHRTYGVEVDPQCVVVTSGSSPAIFLLLAALLDPGCEIILTDPHYACYPNFVRFLDGVPRFVDASAETDFQLNPMTPATAANDRTRPSRNSPSNRAGIVMAPEECGIAQLHILHIGRDLSRSCVRGQAASDSRVHRTR